MKDKRPFLHELTPGEIDKILAEKIKIGELMERYRQPDWCGYPGALEGQMGCWSLMDLKGLRCKISKDFCCDCPELRK